MTHSSGTGPSPITLRSSQDLLASIPYQLGFRPAESVVLACVSARRRLDLVARVDLDDLDGGPATASVLDSLARAVRQVGPAWCAVVVYTSRTQDAVTTAVERVRTVVGPTTDLDEWIVTPAGYRGLGCQDETCCPAAGHPLEVLQSSTAGAEHVLAGHGVADSAADAFGIATAERAVRGLTGRAARRSEDALARAADGGCSWRRGALDAWRRSVRHAVTAGGALDGFDPAVLGRVAAGLADTSTRDAVLLTLVPGGEAVAEATIDALPDAERATAGVLAGVTDPGEPVRPDPTRSRAATTALEAVVAHAPRRLTAAPLTLLGFLAWWQGDGARASFRVSQALEAEPDHRLALLLGSVLSAGLPPGWIRARVASGSQVALTSGRSVR